MRRLAAPAAAPRHAAAALRVVVRCRSSVPVDKNAPPPSFGNKVGADDTSPAQLMHDASKGKFAYIGDFAASLNRGPVKLDYGKDSKPLTEKEKAMDELNERNLKLIQRSLLIGSLAAAGGCFLGWQLTKWYYGVRNMNEFAEVMKQKMPKVSGSMEDSMIGRTLKEQSLHSRDAISENKELTDWRRSLRGKFNTEEGARIARQNSMMLAEKREQERIARKSNTNSNSMGSVTAMKDDAHTLDATTAVVALADPAGGTGDEQPSATMASAAATEAQDDSTLRRLTRKTSQVFQDVERGVVQGGSTAVETGSELVRTTSRVLDKSVRSLKSYVSQNVAPETPPPAAEPKA